ncbi:hypothetical protein BJ508DRAFT_145934 [Ascobolus immersus RN42]|uniref:Uncharacterized protein n=1 Tax=Ascobolus immersus RN42 TaxID=1160509 RepID=A0A3N4IBK2_ASCIM|nr:hypothetical protein BJ508DRAFT_145934 [Ascobolus immersus RN42]
MSSLTLGTRHFFSTNPRKTAMDVFPDQTGKDENLKLDSMLDFLNFSEHPDMPTDNNQPRVDNRKTELDDEEKRLFLNLRTNFRAIRQQQGDQWTQNGVWDFRVWHQKEGRIPRYAKSFCVPFRPRTFFDVKQYFSAERNAHSLVAADQAYDAVSQLIAFASKTVLITIAPVPREELEGETIFTTEKISHTFPNPTSSLVEDRHRPPHSRRKSRLSQLKVFTKASIANLGTPVTSPVEAIQETSNRSVEQVIRVTTEHRQSYVFPLKYCNTWFVGFLPRECIAHSSKLIPF